VIRVHVVVSGRVQGVGYRAEAQRYANQLGLSGWVRNQPDESVEILAEGPDEKVEEFLSWCRSGPFLANVEKLTIERRKFEGDLREFVRH
jgi:acylphosphatase